MKRFALILLSALVAVFVAIQFGNDLLRGFEADTPSRSHGSLKQGWLENGKRLPTDGANFTSYSRLGALLGRTSVHHRVRATMLESFEALRRELPAVTFMIGETGWPGGGRIRPHVTHQNGLSVDFMVPVRRQGSPASIPSTLFNKFGYGLEFDSTGRADDLEIDFEAMATHLDHLERAALRNGLAIEVVIFDNELQKRLLAMRRGSELKERIRFSTKKPWIRHDEHYHVDFALPDEEAKNLKRTLEHQPSASACFISSEIECMS